jgi:hypothetical protein
MSTSGCDIQVHRFAFPKDGTSSRECEDAFAINWKSLVFAIADGATESFDSRTWAQLLVRSWVRIIPPAFDVDDFAPLIRDLGFRLRRKWSRRTLPWYAEEKALQGSFAAFLGMQISCIENEISWRAMALGDCCLVHRVGERIEQTFPIVNADEFGNNPSLIPSNATTQIEALNLLKYAEGKTVHGADFLMLSDAVGSWFLRRLQANDRSGLQQFDKLTGMDDSEGLAQFLLDIRKTGQLKNDDVTILRIVVV